LGGFADSILHPVRHDSPCQNSLATVQIAMNTSSCLITESFIFAAVGALALLCGAAQATDREVVIKVPVSTAGLDLSQPAGARELYTRLQYAARIACTDGRRVDLEPATNFPDCYEKALGSAVQSAHQPQLSTVYLANHTLRDAAAYGIEVPARVATE
jgi:UrcA family protein